MNSHSPMASHQNKTDITKHTNNNNSSSIINNNAEQTKVSNAMHTTATTTTPSPFLPVDVLHHFNKSITTAAETCLNFFRCAASQNPFFTKFISFSSDFHNFSQVHLRSYRDLNSLSSHNFAAVLPGDSVAGVVVSNGILNFLNLYNTVLVVRLVLTWFPNAPAQIVSPLSTLCDPYLNIFRGIIPPLGGTLDLSPILAFLVLNAFTSAATALPAELPSDGVSHPGLSELTSSQKKWQRRLQGNKSSNSDSPK